MIGLRPGAAGEPGARGSGRQASADGPTGGKRPGWYQGIAIAQGRRERMSRDGEQALSADGGDLR